MVYRSFSGVDTIASQYRTPGPTKSPHVHAQQTPALSRFAPSPAVPAGPNDLAVCLSIEDSTEDSPRPFGIETVPRVNAAKKAGRCYGGSSKKQNKWWPDGT